MKRLISILLLIAMLATSLLFLASCGNTGDDEEDGDVTTSKNPQSNKKPKLEENAAGAILEGLDAALTEFFTDDGNIRKNAEKALEAGKLVVTFDGSQLADVIDTEVNGEATIYFDSANQKSVLDFLLNADGDSLSARLFAGKDGFAFSSPEMLGSSKTLLLNLDTFATAIESGFLGDMIAGEGTAYRAELTEAVNQIVDAYKKAFDTAANQATAEAQINAVLACLAPVIKSEKRNVSGANLLNCKILIDLHTVNPFDPRFIVATSCDKKAEPHRMIRPCSLVVVLLITSQQPQDA